MGFLPFSATVLDSGHDSFVQDGSKNSKIEFECVPGFMSTYSLNVQKNLKREIYY